MTTRNECMDPADQIEIQQLVNRYPYHLDAAQFDDAAALFADADGPDRARAHSLVLVVQAPGLGDLKMVTTGDYLDKFAKVDGVWQFTERHIGTDLFGDMADHLLRAMPMSEDMRPQRW